MFHNRFRLAVLLILLTGGFSFAQSKTIRNLQLDFSRTENSVYGKNAMSGSLFFKNNPYIFVFNIAKPEVQSNYINPQGCFFKDSSGLYDFPEGVTVLNQTCTDILTWFKKDAGLKDSGYLPDHSYIENNQTITVWKYVEEGNHPLGDIHVYTDAKGTIYKLQMFLEDGTISAETDLSNFIEKTGYYFPQKVSTKSYYQGKLAATTVLEFSNIVINQLGNPYSEYYGNKLQLTKSNEVSGIKNSYIISKFPLIPTYRTSTTSILVNVAFKGYKAFITNQDNSNCPFEPSCSQYMLDAVSQNGVFGFFQGLERLRRCTQEEHSSNRYITNEKGKHVDPYIK